MSHTFDVYYDPTCPYVYRVALWLERLVEEKPELLPRWRPFSLSQVNNRRQGWDIWRLPVDSPKDWLDRRTRGMWGQWTVLAAAQQGEEAERRYLGALLRLVHEEEAALESTASSDLAAARAGLDLDRWRADSRDPSLLSTLRASHEQAIAMGIFGTPTFHFPGAEPIYLKLRKVPAAEDAAREWERFLDVATGSPLMLELKRPH